MRLRNKVVLWALGGALLHNIFPLTSPIHEFGHVIAAYLSGGEGWITGWAQCAVTRDSVFVALFGQWFEAAVLWTVGTFAVFKFRQSWGGWFMGAAPVTCAHLFRLTDWTDVLRMWPARADGAGALYVILFAGYAFYAWLFSAMDKEDRKQFFSLKHA